MMAVVHGPGLTMLQFLFLALVVIAAIVGTFRQQRAGRNRSFDLQTLAGRLGFDDFSPKRNEGFMMGWGFLSQLSRGDDRYAFNIFRGKYHEQALFVFDYHYQTGSGKNREEHEATMLMLVVKEAFPQLTIGPETLGQKIETAIGLGDDIQFESAEFSRKFSVRCKDKKFAYDVCNAQMIDYLLRNPGLQAEFQGPVISLTFEPQLPVEQIELNLQRLIEIRSRLPEYLFTET